MVSPPLQPFILILLLSSFAILMVVGDEFDDAISAKVSELAIRGAAITYFDKNKMRTPVTRGYGQVSSGGSASAVTPDTAFMLASISKPFVASAVAILVDKGVISSIDEDICDVIPAEYSYQMCRNPKYPDEKITWRMMLTHRSSMKRSIPSAKNQEGDWICPSCGPTGGYNSYEPAAGNPTCPLEGVVDFYRALLSDHPDAETTVGAGVKLQGGKDLNWYDLANSEGGMWEDYEPGAKVEYSNAAYGYLPALIELATAQSFSEFCRENLFDPLGMDHTAWFREDLPTDTLKAVPVQKKNNGGFRDIGHYCYIEYGSGQLHTSANDLAKWGDAMLEYGAPTLWSSDIGREVVKCQERDENNELIQTDCEFGYGWILLSNSMKRRTRRLADSTASPSDALTSDDSTKTSSITTTSSETTDAPTTSTSSSDTADGPWWLEGFTSYDWTDGITHDGSDAGCQTNILILPKSGLYVAVVTNTDSNSDTAAQELIEAVIDAPLPTSSRKSTSESQPMDEDEFPKESSSFSWRSLSWSSMLMRATALSLASCSFTNLFL
jgi:CubicO group peptidase (beta-lactamase class C family)